MRRVLIVLVASFVAAAGTTARPAPAAVTGAIAVSGPNGSASPADVAVWLSPAGAGQQEPAIGGARHRMVQKNKRFTPRTLVVQVGSAVEFPNADPFFHNVFSMYDGKRFDLGLYEAGTSRTVTFTRPGVCFVFCNIHPDMSAVIVVVDTPYAAVSAANGSFVIPDVPPGRYTLSVWHDRYTPSPSNAFPREITISETTRGLGTLRLTDPGTPIAQHKNKYGRDYPPAPAGPVYKK